jgi:hypothetical protein
MPRSGRGQYRTLLATAATCTIFQRSRRYPTGDDPGKGNITPSGDHSGIGKASVSLSPTDDEAEGGNTWRWPFATSTWEVYIDATLDYSTSSRKDGPLAARSWAWLHLDRAYLSSLSACSEGPA